RGRRQVQCERGRHWRPAQCLRQCQQPQRQASAFIGGHRSGSRPVVLPVAVGRRSPPERQSDAQCADKQALHRRQTLPPRIEENAPATDQLFHRPSRFCPVAALEHDRTRLRACRPIPDESFLCVPASVTLPERLTVGCALRTRSASRFRCADTPAPRRMASRNAPRSSSTERAPQATPQVSREGMSAGRSPPTSTRIADLGLRSKEMDLGRVRPLVGAGQPTFAEFSRVLCAVLAAKIAWLVADHTLRLYMGDSMVYLQTAAWLSGAPGRSYLYGAILHYTAFPFGAPLAII